VAKNSAEVVARPVNRLGSTRAAAGPEANGLPKPAEAHRGTIRFMAGRRDGKSRLVDTPAA